MKTLKKIFAAFAAAAMLAGCATEESDPASLKVLAVGNSFSLSVFREMPLIANAMALDLDLHSLYIGGCSLKRHVQNCGRGNDPEFRPYAYDRNYRGRMFPQRKVNLPEILEGKIKFDVITIQQASHESWNPETYHPWGDDLVRLIRRHQPQAKIWVQETWSYTPWDKRLANWGLDQNSMYDRLHAAYAAFAKPYGFKVIPTGTAVQEWRRRLPVEYTDHSFGGDVVGGRFQKPGDRFKRKADNTWEPNCDLFHLNEKGEHLQSLVWIAALFGEDVTACDYRPAAVSESEAKLMREIAREVSACE